MFRIGLVDAFNRVAVILLVGIVVITFHRQKILDASDPYKCGALLEHGQWLDSPAHNPPRNPFSRWQPPGCLFHEYRTEEIASCGGNGKFLFVGDAGTRQVFWATARKIEGDTNWVNQEQARLDTHGDLEFSSGGVHLKFMWDPWLNSSTLHYELEKFWKEQEAEEEENIPFDGKIMDFGARRTIAVLIGGGLWHARHLQSSAVSTYNQAIDDIVAAAYKDREIGNLRTLEHSSEGVGQQVFFAPVIEPQYEELSPSRENTIVPEKINAMNDHLAQLSVQGLNVLWSFANITKGQPEAYGVSGLHVIERVATRMSDLVLNLRCNGKAAQRELGSLNRTCCVAYRPTNAYQYFVAIAFLLIVPFTVLKKRYPPGSSERIRIEKFMPSVSTSRNFAMSLPTALLGFLLSACFCYLIDRTQMFDKLPNYFSYVDFWILLALAVAVCLFTLQSCDDAATHRHPRSHSDTNLKYGFLPRVQSDEFKGWMQIFILIFAYSGGVEALELYEFFRVCLAVYLFLTGYGHTMYFLEKGNYSFQRMASVLVRLNLLAVFLSFMMDRSYLSYTWAPLVSFWFLIVWATCRTSCRHNNTSAFMLGKVFVFAVVITLFIHIRGPLEMLSLVFKITCRAYFNAEEWRYILGVDKYPVFLGMVFAIIHVRITIMFNTPESQRSESAEVMVDSFGTFRVLVVFSAIVLGPLFWITAQSHTRISDYDWFMPYLSWMPVLFLIIMRNRTHALRSRYVAAFSWVGRMSLELYLLSQHIWLAGDGRGVARLGFRRGSSALLVDRWRDMILMTPVFVWCAWWVADGTKTLTAWIAGPGEDSDDRKHVERHGHARGSSGLMLPDYGNGLPSSRVRRDSDQGHKEADDGYGMQLDVKYRMLVLGVIVWTAKWFS